MKKWLISIVVLLAFTVLNPMLSITGYAEEVTTITNAQKPWTVTFNQLIKESSVTNESVKIVDEQQNQLNVGLKVDGKKVVITPKEKYAANKKYTLIITNAVVSQSNKALTKQTTKSFVLKATNKMGNPIVSPSTTIALNSSPNLFYASIKVDVQTPLADYDDEYKSSVTLSFKNAHDEWEEVGELFDNGNLDYSKDEIKGDGYYSLDLSDIVSTDTVGKQYYKIEAKFVNGDILTKEFTINVVDTIQEEAVVEAQNYINSVVDELSTESMDKEVFQEQIISNLKANDSVTNVVALDEVIEVTFTSGVKNILNVVNPSTVSNSSAVKNKAVPDFDAIEDGDVLIWSPRMTGYNFGDLMYTEKQKEMFQKTGAGYSVNTVSGRWATLDALKNMTSYGTVILNADSFLDTWLSTGEEQEDVGMYLVEQTNGEMATVQDVYFEDGYAYIDSNPRYVVNEKWFANNLSGTFNNSLIVNEASNSGNTSALWNVFSNKGAGAYVGTAGKLSAVDSNKSFYTFFSDFVNNQTLSEALYQKGSLKAYGNLNLKYDITWSENAIMNGDFEAETTSSNKVPGWNYVGDGRVVPSLGNLVYPTQGNQMGLISTGLGFTENLGEMEQTFKISESATTLSFDWNYLSEEFLEYIGTGFDDPFSVTLETLDGNYSEKILDLSVNKLAEQFDALDDFYDEGYYDEETDEYYGVYQKSTSGKLVHVSPEITFDDGDVWMTDWQQKEFVLPQEVKGKLVRLVFSAQDAQDSIYDTVVLIDNVQVK